MRSNTQAMFDRKLSQKPLYQKTTVIQPTGMKYHGFNITEYFVVLIIQPTCLAIPFSATQNQLGKTISSRKHTCAFLVSQPFYATIRPCTKNGHAHGVEDTYSSCLSGRQQRLQNDFVVGCNLEQQTASELTESPSRRS